MSAELRRNRRRSADAGIPVLDAMTGQPLGHVGNLSASGMLLIASTALEDDALYQVRFALPAAGAQGPDDALELGAHLLWREPAGAPGLAWAGFRFIALSSAQARALRAWVAAADGGHRHGPSA